MKNDKTELQVPWDDEDISWWMLLLAAGIVWPSATYVDMTVWNWHVVEGARVLFGVEVTPILFWQMAAFTFTQQLYRHKDDGKESGGKARALYMLTRAFTYHAFVLGIGWALNGVWS